MLHIHWKVHATLNPPVSISKTEMTQASREDLVGEPWGDSAACLFFFPIGFTFKPVIIFSMLSMFINLFYTHMNIVLQPWWLEPESPGIVVRGCG